jgi:isopentenyl-diphosphate delta-isomerase
MARETVILVDERDRAVGEMEKLEAHRLGKLHRAISVLVLNGNGELLVQQRAAGKYHCPGIWANTCCSHPRPGEEVLAAAHRRLREEMGFDCPLRFAFAFTYRAAFPNGLVEHEFDHVFLGTYDGPIAPDPAEVAQYAWRSRDEILSQIRAQPASVAPWFVMILDRLSQTGWPST